MTVSQQETEDRTEQKTIEEKKGATLDLLSVSLLVSSAADLESVGSVGAAVSVETPRLPWTCSAPPLGPPGVPRPDPKILDLVHLRQRLSTDPEGSSNLGHGP